MRSRARSTISCKRMRRIGEIAAAVRAARAITAREIDTIVTWATGGTPEGDAAKRPMPKTQAADWRGGPPDLVLRLDSYAMAPQIQDEERDFTVATGMRETRWLKA